MCFQLLLGSPSLPQRCSDRMLSSIPKMGSDDAGQTCFVRLS
jgi:hypothetical protein